MKTVTVLRFDRSPLARTQRLDNGWMRTPAHLTRIGVFEYRRGDGSIRRELRHPDEVFNADSLASFDGVLLTDDHPPAGVDAKNARELGRGTVTKPRRDGDLVLAELLVMDAATVTKVENGKRELSCGYTCDLDETPGVWTDSAGQAHPYDAVQRNIRGNHVAIVARGRAGPEARVRLDATDAERVDAELALYAVGDRVRRREPWGPKQYEGKVVEVRDSLPGYVGPAYSILFDGETVASGQDPEWPFWLPGEALELVPQHDTKQDERNDHMKIRLDGVEVELPDTAAQLVTKMQEKHTAALDKEKARADALDEQVKALNTKLTEATDVKRFDTAVQARVELLDKARSVMGAEFKADGMTDKAIKLAVLGKLSPALKLDGKSDAYVDARFDTAMEIEQAKNPATEAAREALNGGKGNGAAPVQARADKDEDAQTAFERSLFRDRSKDK